MGRPASIIVAKRRVKVTRSFELTPVPRVKRKLFAFFLTLVGVSCCARRRALTASASSASMFPLRSSPERARASHANSAMDKRLLVRHCHGQRSRGVAAHRGKTYRRRRRPGGRGRMRAPPRRVGAAAGGADNL